MSLRSDLCVFLLRTSSVIVCFFIERDPIEYGILFVLGECPPLLDEAAACYTLIRGLIMNLPNLR